MRERFRTVTKEIIRRHRADFLIVLFMSILMLLGLVVIYSISPALTARINAGGNTLDQNHFMYRQLVYLLIGVAAFVGASLVPLEFWQKHKGKLLIGALLLCLVPVIGASTPVALCTNGACRWIDLGFTTIQPAEIIKFALVIFLSGFIALRTQQQKLNDVNDTLIPVGVLLGIVALVVIVLQKDLGTGLAIFGIVTTMLFVAGLDRKYFMISLGVLLAGGLLFILTSAHRLERVATFFNGADEKSASGYHIHQALIAVGMGGWTGKGLGESIQAFGYLPEAANDSIFAIVAEKFGFIGTVAILLLFAALFIRILRVMDHTGTEYHRLIVAGIFGWIFTHTLVNIGAMLGIFPLTGITLPFLSFGGTSLLFIMLGLGVVLNISRYTVHRSEISEKGGVSKDENRRSRRGIGGTRHSGTSRY